MSADVVTISWQYFLEGRNITDYPDARGFAAFAEVWAGDTMVVSLRNNGQWVIHDSDSPLPEGARERRFLDRVDALVWLGEQRGVRYEVIQ